MPQNQAVFDECNTVCVKNKRPQKDEKPRLKSIFSVTERDRRDVDGSNDVPRRVVYKSKKSAMEVGRRGRKAQKSTKNGSKMSEIVNF